MGSEPSGWRRRDLAILGAALLLGAALRAFFVVRTDVPIYDPWRHLKLVENLRAGLGFTLFDGQPYIWYSPVWYRIAAALPRSVEPIVPAAILSWLSIPLIYFWLLRSADARSRSTAAAGAFLVAAFGPFIAFTCHHGSEAFAIFVAFAAVLLVWRSARIWGAVAAGVLFGISLAARINLVFDAFLALPALRSRRRAVGFAAGAALPLAAAWWRNHRAIASYSYVFTWDGLATRSSDFNVFSTLVVQMHPAVREGLRRLHDQIVPVPEWIAGPGGIAWARLAFLAAGVVCLVAVRRRHLLLAAASTAAYFLFLDGSRSSHFFRVWLGVFPVLFAAIAEVAGRLGERTRSLLGVLLVAGVLASGADMLRPPPMLPLEAVTPPPDLLTEDAYMVSSTFYHPESLIYRFSGRRFIGMPLDPAEFDEFRRAFPEYRAVLWHDFSVQEPLRLHLLTREGYAVAKSRANPFGRKYTVLAPPSAPDPEAAPPAPRAEAGGPRSEAIQ